MKNLMLIIASASFILAASPLPAGAVPSVTHIVSDQTCNWLSNKNVAGCGDHASLTGGNGYLMTLIDAIIFLAGFLAVLFLVIGGVRYITSTGDSSKIQSAKNTVIYSVVGLVLVILARTIIGFVIGNLKGAGI